MATLDELKAKLQSIINEYKVVSKEKNKTFGIAATPTIKDYHFVVKDEKPVKEDAKWIGKRTITKVESRGPSRYENIYAEALDANGEPALISPADADGELPAAAKDAKDKNLLALAARLKEVGGNTLTVGLIWDIANPHDKPNPNPQEFPYYEIVDSDFKEVVKGQKWTAKRTITKKMATAPGAKNVYKNVYTSALVGGQPKTLNGEGDLPNSAKSRTGKNFADLSPKMKGETLTVDLVWEDKPTEEEVQKARGVVRELKSVSSVIIALPHIGEEQQYPILDEPSAKAELTPVANALALLKRAGIKPFTINVTWRVKPEKERLKNPTNEEMNKAAKVFCSEFVRGLVISSNGQLRTSDFIINAQGYLSQEQDFKFSISIP